MRSDVESIGETAMVVVLVASAALVAWHISDMPGGFEQIVSPELKHASFELRLGEILGIASIMRIAGRMQMVRTICGIERAASGTIKLKGSAVSARGGTPAMQPFQRLGYLSEDRKGEGLALTLSIADNITMTRFSSCWRWLNLSRQRERAKSVVKELCVKARTVSRPGA